MGHVPKRASDPGTESEKERETGGRAGIDRTGGDGEDEGLDSSILEMSSLAVGVTRTSWIMDAIMGRYKDHSSLGCKKGGACKSPVEFEQATAIYKCLGFEG